MLGDTHAIAGALSAAVVMSATGAPTVYWVPALIAGAVGGLIPDIDMPGSTASRSIPGLKALHNGRIVLPMALFTAAAWAIPRFFHVPLAGDSDLSRAWIIPAAATVVLTAASWLLKEVLWHRGPTHSLLALLVFAVGVKLLWMSIPLPIWLSLVAGYLSHLVIDSFNPTGCAWLWPLSPRKWSVNHSILLLPLRPLVVRTGSMGELWGWRPVLGLMTVLLLVMHFAERWSL